MKATPPTLVELSLEATINNFGESPFYPEERLNRKLTSQFHSMLPTDTSLSAASYVENEEYWKRSCKGRGVIRTNTSGEEVSYKRMFFELQMQHILKELSRDTISETLTPFADHINTLSLSSLKHDFPVDAVCFNLPNLTKIELHYGTDCRGSTRFAGLAKAISSSPCLTSLVIKESQINDDDLGSIFGDTTDSTILHLDLSHNKLTSKGMALIADKFLLLTSVLSSLDLSGNSIDKKGGEVLGKCLVENESLLSLNLRLNKLGDEGGESLFQGLIENKTIRHVNTSANKLGSKSAAVLSQLLSSSRDIESVILSSNAFSEDNLKVLLQYKSCSVDTRSNDYLIDEMSSLASEVPCSK